MFSSENDNYEFEDWISDLVEARDGMGFPGWLLILLTMGFAFWVIWCAMDFLPSGTYPRIVLILFMVPALPIIWVFYQLVGRLIHLLLVDGTSRPR
jgi:hypothetical protein